MAHQGKYRLTYFNAQALGEPIRILFACANFAFEDIRIANEDWPSLKSSKYVNKSVNIWMLMFHRAIYFWNNCNSKLHHKCVYTITHVFLDCA